MRAPAVVVLLGIAASVVVQAAPVPCIAETVTQMQGTTCTIGNLTFQFPSVTSFDLQVITGNPHPGTLSSSPISTDNLFITPDAANPLSVGFILSGTKGFPLSLTGTDPGMAISFRWDYTVGVTDPSSGAAIIGTTVNETGATGSQADPTHDVVGANGGSTINPSGSCFDITQAGFFINDGVTFFNRTSQSDSSCATPVTQTSATAGLGVSALNGSASLTSVGFYFDEQTAQSAPEPSSLVLTGCALAVLRMAMARLRTVPRS